MVHWELNSNVNDSQEPLGTEADTQSWTPAASTGNSTAHWHERPTTHTETTIRLEDDPYTAVEDTGTKTYPSSRIDLETFESNSRDERPKASLPTGLPLPGIGSYSTLSCNNSRGL